MGSLKQIYNYGTAYSGEGGYKKVVQKDKKVGPEINANEIAHPLTSHEHDEIN